MSIVSVNYEITNEDDSKVTLDVLFNVTFEHDSYGTGDSPSGYVIELESCITEDGEEYNFNNLNKYDTDRIEEIACEKVRGY